MLGTKHEVNPFDSALLDQIRNNLAGAISNVRHHTTDAAARIFVLCGDRCDAQFLKPLDILRGMRAGGDNPVNPLFL